MNTTPGQQETRAFKIRAVEPDNGSFQDEYRLTIEGGITNSETVLVSRVELLELMIVLQAKTLKELCQRSFELPAAIYEWAVDAVSRLVTEHRYTMRGYTYVGPLGPEYEDLDNRAVLTKIVMSLARQQSAPDLREFEHIKVWNAMRELLCSDENRPGPAQQLQGLARQLEAINRDLSITERDHKRFPGSNAQGTVRFVMTRKQGWGWWSRETWYIVLQLDAKHPVLIEKG